MRFSLVVATLGRQRELVALLDSLAAQSIQDFEVIIVDQNEDDRLVASLAAFPSLNIRRVPCASRALSLARNLGLAQCTGSIVGFPDDDCLYQAGTLAMVDAAFRADQALSLLSGPAISTDGALSSGRWSDDHGPITVKTVWTAVIAFNLFVRRDVLVAIGGFDEALGIGARFGSAEEADLAIRVIQTGAKGVYDPGLRIIHPDKRLTPAAVARAFSYGAGLGRVLRKHRVSRPIASQFFVRPLGGIVLSLLRGRFLHMRYYRRTLGGRIYGYLATVESPTG
jgi:GT2 family glycosyltransferase